MKQNKPFYNVYIKEELEAAKTRTERRLEQRRLLNKKKNYKRTTK